MQFIGEWQTVAEAILDAWEAGELRDPAKVATAQTKQYTHDYADLQEVVESYRSAMLSRGVLTFQGHTFGEGVTMLTTRLAHVESGGMIEIDIEMPASDSPQKLGSALTYVKRYALVALFNMITPDDDANAAEGTAATISRKGQHVATVKPAEEPKAVADGAFVDAVKGRLQDGVAALEVIGNVEDTERSMKQRLLNLLKQAELPKDWTTITSRDDQKGFWKLLDEMVAAIEDEASKVAEALGSDPELPDDEAEGD